MPLVVLLAAVLAVAGCGRSLPEPADEKPIESAPSPMPVEVSLQLITPEALDAVIAGHRGRPVLVDYWATWCTTCLELFPHTVELHRRYADQGLVVISVSMDLPKSRGAAEEFLRSQRATFPNYLSSLGASADALAAFRIDDYTLPHLKIYDRQGHLQTTLGPRSFTPQEIDAAVERALAPAAGEKQRPAFESTPKQE